MPNNAPLLYADKLKKHARETPDALAVWTPKGTLTYSELLANAERFAAAMQSSGCTPGDRVVLMLHSSCIAAELTVATCLIRSIPAPMSTAVPADTIALLLADCAPKLIIVDEEFLPLLEGAALENINIVVVGSSGKSDAPSLEDWLSANSQNGMQATQAEYDDILTILYSSGTTSIPKGMTHCNGPRVAFWSYLTEVGGGQLSGSRYGLTTPFYTSGTFSSLMSTLYGGGAVALLPSFDTEQFISLVEEGLINTAFLVPVQVRRILDSEGYSAERMANFKHALISGSACDQATKQRIIDHWPGQMIDAYGCSETQLLAYDDMKSTDRKPGSVGKIRDYATVVILGDDDSPLSVGETGEIVASTPGQQMCYYNQPEQTKAVEWVDENGEVFIRTGDIGRIDEEGYLYVTDRKKDMIVSGGFNVYSYDIENVFMQRDEVSEVAVIAIPSERWGETPYAFVVVAENVNVDAAELKDWVNERLGKMARISDLKFVDDLPRNNMGKVEKKVLRAPFWKGREVGVA